MKSHTDALSKKMLKPKRDLGDEVQVQLSKITDYAPEVLGQGKSPSDLPWDSARDLANAIINLKRTDLTKAWDTVISGKRRARIVSHVYGSTFPFNKDDSKDFELRNRNKAVINLKSIESIANTRNNLVQYSTQNAHLQRKLSSQVQKKLWVAAGLVGSSLLLFTVMRKNSNVQGKKL